MYPTHWAALSPDKTAIVDFASGESLSYAELADRATRFGRLLKSYGLGPGDHAAILLENHIRFFEIVWGALQAGLYVTTVSRYAPVDEAAYVLNDSGADVVVASSALAEMAGQLPAEVNGCSRWLMVDGTAEGFASYEEALTTADTTPFDPDGPIGDYMLYSSGTTGRPKGILRPLSGKTIADGPQLVDFLAKVFRFDDDSVYLSPAPLYHGAPMGFSTATLALGGTVVMLRKFEPTDALRAIEQHRVTHSQWVPTMFVRFLKLTDEEREGFDLSSHRVAIHSAAPCPRHVKQAMMDWWGPVLHEYYSGTEGPGITYVSPKDWLERPGTVGRPLGVKVHICDDEGNELPTGEAGRVYFEQPRATFDYHGDKEKTKSSRHPEHPNWMTLDDVGRLDEDGFLYLTDRASFMIISGGVNIYPQEIEDCLIAHPSVEDVAVIGVPNAEMGEEVKAVVQLGPGSEGSDELEAELIAYAREHLAAYKRPRSIDFTDELPRLPTGKLYKAKLREQYWADRETRIL